MSLLFIELQVEMCGFGGASPLPNPPSLGHSSSQRRGMGGVVRGLGHWGGVSRVPAGLVAPRIKHGEHGRQRAGWWPASALALWGRGLLYKVILRGGPGYGPEKPMGPAGLAESGVSTWLPRTSRPAQPAWGASP